MAQETRPTLTKYMGLSDASQHGLAAVRMACHGSCQQMPRSLSTRDRTHRIPDRGTIKSITISRR